MVVKSTRKSALRKTSRKTTNTKRVKRVGKTEKSASIERLLQKDPKDLTPAQILKVVRYFMIVGNDVFTLKKEEVNDINRLYKTYKSKIEMINKINTEMWRRALNRSSKKTLRNSVKRTTSRKSRKSTKKVSKK